MSLKRTLIKGTFLLTAAGMISRLIGFYYRIFLTQTIGAEGIGIYQLIFPVYALCFSLTSAGIQTTVSRLVAANDTSTQFRVFHVGLSLSIILAVLSSFFVYHNAHWLALEILQEERCENLLRILSLTIPLGSIHSIASGYYFGINKAVIPSVSQLVEQMVRVLGVYLMVTILSQRHQLVTVDVAVWGLVFGEAASSLLSLTALKIRQGKAHLAKSSQNQSIASILSLLIRQSAPLTANRIVINALQSIEAILIPSMLKAYGLKTSEALSTYGILTGMALPLIMFPSAITNSVSVMLLPAVAQAQAEQKTSSIQSAVENSIKYCLFLGIYCTGMFLCFGKDMGSLLFHNAQAGKFIVTLAWICPFLYITSTLGSIVHGLGKTFLYFVYNSISLLLRIGFVALAIPKVGILGYLWGILFSQLILTLFLLLCLSKECQFHLHPAEYIVFPMLYISIAAFIGRFTEPLLDCLYINGLGELILKCIVVFSVYIGLAVYFGSITLFSRKNL